MKKALSVILSLALMLSCVTVAFAADPAVTDGSEIEISVAGPNGNVIYANEEITLGFTVDGDFNGETFSVSVNDTYGNSVYSSDCQFDSYSDTDNKTSLSLTLGVFPDAGAYTVEALYNEPDGTEGDIIQHYGSAAFEILKNETSITITSIETQRTLDYEHPGGKDPDQALYPVYTVADGVPAYNDTLRISFTVAPAQATGDVVFSISGLEFTASASDGYVEVSGFDAGAHDIRATYMGDGKYAASQTTDKFNLVKAPSSVEISAEKVVLLGEYVEVDVTTTGSDGALNVSIDGTVYPVNNHSFYYYDLDVGLHTITASLHSDNNYGAAMDICTVRVVKPNGTDTASPINIETQDIKYGTKPTFTVSAPSDYLNKEFELIVFDKDNNSVFSGDFEFTDYNDGANPTASVTVNPDINGLNCGKYTVKVIWIDDSLLGADGPVGYYSKADFTVYQYETVLSIKPIENIAFGEDAVIELELSPSHTYGEISVFVDGVEYKTDTDNLQLTVSDLEIGVHNVRAVYGDDGYGTYQSNEATASFIVTKIPTEIDIETVATLYANENYVFAVTVNNANVTGEIEYYIDGVKYIRTLVNGTTSIKISSLSLGLHTISAYYAGDDFFGASIITDTFEVVEDETPEFMVKTACVHPNEQAVVTATLDGDVVSDPLVNSKYTCTFTVFDINDTAVYEQTVNFTSYDSASNQSTAEVALDMLPEGEYIVNAKCTISDGYPLVGYCDSTRLVVSKIETEVEFVSISNVTVGDENMFTVKLTPEPADVKNIDIYINGEKYTVTSDNPTLKVPDLYPGSYFVRVVFEGDDVYKGSKAFSSFDVSKIVADLELDAPDTSEGEAMVITATVDDDATGSVVMSVCGTDYSADVNDGKAVVTIDNLTAGTYTVVATYSGDDRYNSAVNHAEFIVTGPAAAVVADAIGIEAENAVFGESVTLSVTVEGNHTGENYLLDVHDSTGGIALQEIANLGSYDPLMNQTEAEYEIAVLNADTYFVEAVFTDANGNKSNASCMFTVAKADTVLSIEPISSITVGEDVTINMQLDSDMATGTVYVYVNGDEYSVDVDGNGMSLTVSDVSAGNYLVRAVYDGDEDFNGSKATASFVVIKADTSFTVEAADVYETEEATLVFTLPDDATGIINVTVNGVGYYVTVTDGKGELIVSGLEAGEYDISSKYLGDDRYSEVENDTATLTVLEEEWSEPEYVWADDFGSCKATRTSITDPSHVEEEEVTAVCTTVREPDYDNEGELLYAATFTNSAFETQTKSVAVPALEYQSQPDVPELSWYYEAAKYCTTHGYMTGYANGEFGASDAIKRQDFVVILARVANADLSGYTECPLSDVVMSAYYGPAVAWAVSEGIIKGYENGKFGVGDSITREQICVILYRYLGQPDMTDADAILSAFGDADKVSPFAKDAMAWAVSKGIITGTNGGTTLSPVDSAERAQVAMIIMRMDKVGMFN